MKGFVYVHIIGHNEDISTCYLSNVKNRFVIASNERVSTCYRI